MDMRQFEALEAYESPEPRPFGILAPDFTSDASDRTLLWGYGASLHGHRGHHVFLKDGKVHMLKEGGPEDARVVTAFDAFADLLPSKRLYPEACDYDFCRFLKERGLTLRFATWDDERTPKTWHGPLRPGDRAPGRFPVPGREPAGPNP